MQHLEVKATTTATTDRGEFSALAATWDTDRQKDRIRRGAFQKSIERWREAQMDVPVHWNHEGGAENVIGSVFPSLMRETAAGLHVEGRLDIEDSEVARQAWRSMKANRVALSFGYLAVASHKAADGVRELTELDLFEVSIVPAPMNPSTRILSMKALTRPSVEELRERCRELGIDPDAKATRPATKATGDVRIATFEVA